MRRTNWQKDRLLHISRDEKLTAYIPRPELIEAAQERTGSMVEYYLLAVRGEDWQKQVDFVARLARSCYLQGAQDVANVAAQMSIKRGEHRGNTQG